MNPENDPLAALQDIEGLDAISWWPPAIGWWIVALLVILMAIGLGIWYWRQRRFKCSWQYAALEELAEITQRQSIQQQATALSELIRRIAIQQYSRKDCAGLAGQQWLNWLGQHDPANFDWPSRAVWLINAPYAPSASMQSISSNEIEAVVQAIKGWIK